MSFPMSYSAAEVTETVWVEPALVWNVICIPNGSGNSLLSKLLHKLVDDTHANLCYESSPLWMISLLKKGATMSENIERKESAMMFSQMIIFHEKNVTECRKLFVFLQFLGVKSWCHKKCIY